MSVNQHTQLPANQYVSQYIPKNLDFMLKAGLAADQNYNTGLAAAETLSNDFLNIKNLPGVDDARKKEESDRYQNALTNIIQRNNGDYSKMLPELRSLKNDFNINKTNGRIGAMENSYAEYNKILKDVEGRTDVSETNKKLYMDAGLYNYNLNGGIGDKPNMYGKYNLYKPGILSKDVNVVTRANELNEKINSIYESKSSGYTIDKNKTLEAGVPVYVKVTDGRTEVFGPEERKALLYNNLISSRDVIESVNQDVALRTYNYKPVYDNTSLVGYESDGRVFDSDYINKTSLDYIENIAKTVAYGTAQNAVAMKDANGDIHYYSKIESTQGNMMQLPSDLINQKESLIRSRDKENDVDNNNFSVGLKREINDGEVKDEVKTLADVDISGTGKDSTGKLITEYSSPSLENLEWLTDGKPGNRNPVINDNITKKVNKIREFYPGYLSSFTDKQVFDIYVSMYNANRNRESIALDTKNLDMETYSQSIVGNTENAPRITGKLKDKFTGESIDLSALPQSITYSTSTKKPASKLAGASVNIRLDGSKEIVYTDSNNNVKQYIYRANDDLEKNLSPFAVIQNSIDKLDFGTHDLPGMSAIDKVTYTIKPNISTKEITVSINKELDRDKLVQRVILPNLNATFGTNYKNYNEFLKSSTVKQQNFLTEKTKEFIINNGYVNNNNGIFVKSSDIFSPDGIENYVTDVIKNEIRTGRMLPAKKDKIQQEERTNLDTPQIQYLDPESE